MLRALLDNNAVDPIIMLPGAFDAVRAKVEAGEVELIGTHILEEELSATPDAERRAKLEKILTLTTKRATSVFVFGVSRLGQAALSGDETAEQFKQLQAGRTDGKNVMTRSMRLLLKGMTR